jgi:hypothetical protein
MKSPIFKIFYFYLLINIFLKSAFSQNKDAPIDIDLTLPEYKDYYNDIKKDLSNLTISENSTNYKFHQILKILKTSLIKETTNETNNIQLESYLLLNELEDTNFFQISISKNYTFTNKSSNLTDKNTKALTEAETKTNTQILNKSLNLFDPSENNYTYFRQMISDFLKFKDLNKEYYFYKGQNLHSCGYFEFNTKEFISLTACTFKQRNINTTFVIGFFNNKFTSNFSDYKNSFYFDKFNRKFEIYNSYFSDKDKLFHYSQNLNDSIITSEFYSYMFNNSLIPVYNVDAYSNDSSEGGFNIVIRRSVLTICLTGALTTMSFLALFLFAKSKKKIYLPVDGGFDKLTNN